MHDLYETVTTNTRNEVAWIYEGMQEMGSKVTDMPGNKSDWITDEMHKMVFTVSVNPSCPATWTMQTCNDPIINRQRRSSDVSICVGGRGDT